MQNEEGCSYPINDPIFKQYHDFEWGFPVDDDTRIFEKICLEGFQSGLSWKTVLHRREYFRHAFNHFEIAEVARYTDTHIENLLQNKNIIRNRRKIGSVINNAKRALQLQSEFGSLAHFLWEFEPKHDQRPSRITRAWLANNTSTEESRKLSKALKRRGWTFIGPTNMYALMQALGLVNDHTENCPCRNRVDAARRLFRRP